ncbi:MAG: amidohydrolase family protein, partial [Chloroflexi bacterium]|nr:amidohydrolase family protein [Chloroflexota bacterium]
SPHLDRVARLAQDAGVPLMVTPRAIMNWGFPYLPAADVSPLLARFPSLRLLLCGVNRVDFAAAVDLARSGDVYLETSCLQELGAVAAAVAQLGPERVLLGTGLPIQYAACGVAKVAHARLADEDRRRVLGANSAALFGIAEPSSEAL